MSPEERRLKDVSVAERSATPNKCEVYVEDHALTFVKVGDIVQETQDLKIHPGVGPLTDVYRRAAKLRAERYMASLTEKQQGGSGAAH